MNRSPGTIPITYTESYKDEYDNVWEKTEQIGIVYSPDILELKEKLDEINKEVGV